MATVRQSGGDYGSLNAACAASQTTIDIDQSWTADDTTAVTCSTANTTVTVSGGASHNGYVDETENHYRLNVSGSHCITVTATGCVFDGLVINQNGTGTSDEGIRISNNGANTIKNCIIWATNIQAAQDGIYSAHINDPTINIEQCVAYNFARRGIAFDQYSSDTTGTTTYNINSCKAWNNGRNNELHAGNINLFHHTGVAGLIKNVVFNIHNTVAVGAVNGTDYRQTDNDGLNDTTTKAVWNISYSLDSDNSIATVIDTGTGNLASRTETDSSSPGTGDWVILEDITTSPYDLRLQDNAENDAQDMHSTATAHSLTIPSTDIVGTSRPQNTDYDCGAFEIVSGAPAAALTPSRIHPMRFLGVR